jgi:putative phosphoribosyl transferase
MIIYADGPIDREDADEPVTSISPFQNLRAAGRELAARLEAYRDRDDVIVLALVLGGVLVGQEVASTLGLPCDYVILRRLTVADGPGSLMAAVNVAGNLEIVGEKLPRPETPKTGFDYFIADALAQLETREKLCRGHRPPLEISGKTVLLVDCGARTGITMQTAITAIRARKPAKIIAAQPVASIGAAPVISSLADEFVCLAYPRPFGNVGVWYKDFTRPADEQIASLLSSEKTRL